MRFSVVNLGCKVNRVESDHFVARLKGKGWEPAPPDTCEVVIINTCTVTGEAEKKTRKAVRRALREAPSAFIVVTGCAAVISPEVFKEMDERVIVEPDKSAVVERVYRLPGVCGCDIEAPPASDEPLSDIRIGEDFVTRVGIKVQDGCDTACTFCIVHKARGKAYSRAFDSILEEAHSYSSAGVRELVLTGINIGSYCFAEHGLADLLAALLDTASQTRFRLSSIEPHTLDDATIEAVAGAEGRICRHLHLPLQSGSPRILKKMARPYSAEEYLGLVERLRGAIPALSLSTDVIVGFPSETEDDFKETLRLCEACGFSKIHVFPYSKREGTPAAHMKNQVEFETKKERTAELSRLSEHLRAEDLRKRKGSSEYALVESRGWATTESYHRISVDSSFATGDLVWIAL